MTSRKNAITLLVGLLIVWKLLVTDWVVTTPYLYHDSDPPASDVYEVRTFHPEPSPIWNPPEPSDYAPTAKTWLHHHFFYMGGAGGPTAEPVLRVDYFAVVWKILAGLIVGLIGLLGVRKIVRKPAEQDAAEQPATRPESK